MAGLHRSQAAPELKASYDPFSNAYEASKVAEALLTGILAQQKGANAKAKSAFEAAVQSEDNLIYDEPRDWPLPARQYLGALLLKTGDYKNAITVFKRDLQINPKNGWSLTGLKLAYNAQHNSAAAQHLDSDLAAAWQIKDRDIAAPVY